MSGSDLRVHVYPPDSADSETQAREWLVALDIPARDRVVLSVLPLAGPWPEELSPRLAAVVAADVFRPGWRDAISGEGKPFVNQGTLFRTYAIERSSRQLGIPVRVTVLCGVDPTMDFRFENVALDLDSLHARLLPPADHAD